MKLVELDQWYKDWENTLDALRLVNWSKLAHAEKLTIYIACEQERVNTEAIQHQAARKYHAKPEVIEYFKRSKLKHESGDYSK